MYQLTKLILTATILLCGAIGVEAKCEHRHLPRHLPNCCHLKEAINEELFATHCHVIEVKGTIDYYNINSILHLDNLQTTFDILATADGVIKKGVFNVSSLAVAPVDPVTNVDFEVHSRVLKIRTFAEYPDIVACYGVIDSNPKKNFVILPLGNLPPGTNRKFSLAGDEFVGLVRRGQRTNFLTAFENQDLTVAHPNPAGVPIEIDGVPIKDAFCTATIQQLMTVVGGFQRVQQFGVLAIKTTGESICTTE